eukprot:scaffold22293_cov31-Tisochrysis_lutea.AAC.4
MGLHAPNNRYLKIMISPLCTVDNVGSGARVRAQCMNMGGGEGGGGGGTGRRRARAVGMDAPTAHTPIAGSGLRCR